VGVVDGVGVVRGVDVVGSEGAGGGFVDDIVERRGVE
jgi:hypothetical protein